MSLKQTFNWLREVIPAFPKKQSKAMDLFYPIKPEPAASLVVPYDENLLERSRTQWQFGDWQSLTQLDREAIQHHPDRAQLAILSAAAHQQTGDIASARQFTRLARDWGCNKKLISQILIAGVHNTLGKASAIAGNQQQAFDHFKTSITTANPGSDLRLLTQARVQSQLEKIKIENVITQPVLSEKKQEACNIIENQNALQYQNDIVKPKAYHKLFSPCLPEHAHEHVHQDVVKATMEQYPDVFTNGDLAWHYLHHMVLPPSLRWTFISVDRNASTSIKKLLFEMEFGAVLNTRFESLIDINPGVVSHMLHTCNVYASALDLGKSANDILELNPHRISIVRNPYDRALSSFIYFCKSNEEKEWFLADRLRINACAGFDWTTMPYTVSGFYRFLKYIEMEIDRLGPIFLNSHWRFQKLFIQPDVFQPTLLGRMENMKIFYDDLFERMEFPPKKAREIPFENKQKYTDKSLLNNKSVRQLIEEIYAIDFETFNY